MELSDLLDKKEKVDIILGTGYNLAYQPAKEIKYYHWCLSQNSITSFG